MSGGRIRIALLLVHRRGVAHRLRAQGRRRQPGQRQDAVRREVRGVPHAGPRRRQGRQRPEPRPGVPAVARARASSARRSRASSTARSCTRTGWRSSTRRPASSCPACPPTSSRARTPRTSPPTWRRPPARAARTPAAWPKAGQTENTKVAQEKGGTLDIPTVASGALAYQFGSAEAKPGEITINSKNDASIPHDIAVEGNGVDEKGEVVQDGGTSTLKADLKPGEYTFYCSVPGHREGGMEGKLTVK